MGKLQKQSPFMDPVEGCVEGFCGGIAWLWSAILSVPRPRLVPDETACLPLVGSG